MTNALWARMRHVVWSFFAIAALQLLWAFSCFIGFLRPILTDHDNAPDDTNKLYSLHPDLAY